MIRSTESQLVLPLEQGPEAGRQHFPSTVLDDYSTCYLSGDLRSWLKDRYIEHISGTAHHPKAQGKIERFNEWLGNVTLADVYEGRRSDTLDPGAPIMLQKLQQR